MYSGVNSEIMDIGYHWNKNNIKTFNLIIIEQDISTTMHIIIFT